MIARRALARLAGAACAVAALAGCASGRPGRETSAPPRPTSFQELASFEIPYVESIVDAARGEASIAIPDSIQALDGARITMDGYVEGGMFPLEAAHGSSSPTPGSRDGFGVLLTSQPFQCCMREPPRASETILVELPSGAEVAGAPHKIMRVVGTLHVAPRIDEAHVLHGIYRIGAEAISESPSAGAPR